MFILKADVEKFKVMDGPFAGRTYEHGAVYAEKDIPPEERPRFMPVTPKDKKSGGKEK